MLYILALGLAYLVGSIPFGIILTRAKGIDLRSIGSGNIGATNVSRALGKPWGYTCFALDVLKGLVPMLLTLGCIRPGMMADGLGEIRFITLWLGVGCSAILGHIFPVYVRFRGGKGVATSFGVALGLWPYYTVCALIALLVWIAIVLKSRYVSLASMLASATFPVFLILFIFVLRAWTFHQLWPLVIIALIIPSAVLFRHRENIDRLRQGTENKIKPKRECAPDQAGP